MQLDNPMASKSQHDDPQCQDEKTFICDFCGDTVGEYDKVKGVDCNLCSDCVGEYCKDKVNEIDIVQSFINSKERDYYIEYYFNGLEPNERLSLIKAMYKIHSKGVDGKKDQYFDELEKEFCLEDDNFFDYLGGEF